MSRQHHRHRRFKLRSFYVWHRYMGISAAVFVLVIAITGLLLNHTGELGLDRRHVQSGWILDWYGIQAPDEFHSYATAGHAVTLLASRLYLDRTRIQGDYYALHGASFSDGIYVIAVDNAILLVTPSGELIERMQNEEGVPAGIEKIGVDAGGLLVAQTGAGFYQADRDLIQWAPWKGDTATVRWAQSAQVEPQVKAALQKRFRDEILPLERVVLDLHSGRFFGRPGPWVFDIAAVLLILLALSGTLIWLKRKR